MLKLSDLELFKLKKDLVSRIKQLTHKVRETLTQTLSSSGQLESISSAIKKAPRSLEAKLKRNIITVVHGNSQNPLLLTRKLFSSLDEKPSSVKTSNRTGR
jgi:hypothetical protein